MITVDKVRALVGHPVRAKIADDVLLEGTLVMFGEGGDFTIQDEMGLLHYCWPLLEIESAE